MISLPIVVMLAAFFIPSPLVMLASAQSIVSDLSAVLPEISLKSLNLEPIDKLGVGEQAVISVSLRNVNQSDISILTFVEVRDSNGITQFLSYQTSEIELGVEKEIGVSWLPVRSDTYTLRTFCVTGFQDPHILSVPVEKEAIVG